MELFKDRTFKEDIPAFAGRWLEYSISTIQDGKMFLPFGVSQKSGFWSGVRESRQFFVADRIEDGTEGALQWFESEYAAGQRRIIVIDVLITMKDGKRDALLAVAVDYKNSNPIKIYLPYRPASDPQGFQTYAPVVELPDGAPHADHIRETLQQFLVPRTSF